MHGTRITQPILFLIFNRPDLTERSFESIRRAQPAELFIAADGPRVNRPGERDLCERARAITDTIDWNCEVRTLFRSQNLGCREAVSSAITWFFSFVEQGIILEDDCLADDTFFPFCSELLDRYREDERVMCITGNNFQNGQHRGEGSYYFSVYAHIWGWASWRRAWAYYDKELEAWPSLKTCGLLDAYFCDQASSYWQNILDSVRDKTVDTWDYAWAFTCWANSGLTATPNSNLVSNIGFDERATHTPNPRSPMANMKCTPLPLPLKHPKAVVRAARADHFVESNVFGIRQRQTDKSETQIHECVRNAKRFARRAASVFLSRSEKNN